MGQINSLPITTQELTAVCTSYQPETLLAVEQGAVTQVPPGNVVRDVLINDAMVSDEISNVICISDDSTDVYQCTPEDVVSYGTVPQSSGDWEYLKFANGRCYLWSRKTLSSVACTTARGNVYGTSAATQMTFPFTVYDAVANVNLAGSGTSTYMFWAGGVTPWQGRLDFFPMCSQSVTLDVIASVFVIGRWV